MGGGEVLLVLLVKISVLSIDKSMYVCTYVSMVYRHKDNMQYGYNICIYFI